MHRGGSPGSAPAEFDAQRLWIRHARARSIPVESGQTFSAEEAIAQVLATTGASREQLDEVRRGRGGNAPKRLAIWWLCEATRLSQADVARVLGVSEVSVSRTRAQLQRGEIEDRELRQWAEALRAYQGVRTAAS